MAKARQQLPPQIKKIEIVDRKTAKVVVRYQVTVDAGINPDTGRRQQVRRRYNSEKAARDALGEITDQATKGMFVPRKAVTVEQLCTNWLASLHNTRATTSLGYEYLLAPLRESYGDVAVQRLTRADLDTLLIALRDGGTKTAKGATRRPWSARSVNKAVDAWRAVLAYGVESREVAYNVAESMKKVPRVRKEMDTYTPAEIGAVLRAADRDRSGHLWYLALSGLRRSEIAGLQWSDVDLTEGTLSVKRGRVQAGAGTVVENEPKTKSSKRTLPLDEGLVAVLKRASARYAEEKLALGAAHADSGYVAVNEAGNPYTPDTLSRMWHKNTKTAKVRPIRLHDARHSCGTAMHLRGVPLAVIAKWLGHADAETTARIYAHSQDAELRAAGVTLGAVVTASH
ncbi:recombinase XerD [Mycolicibacterium rhodesiae]|uniref:Recombinase XerD n=2 Tax=Mycolicibacterium rhodesiae TaxID=36814 RepID=A0A1X0IJK6_MYCRH|nr:site-specific integrase [Mycolicibacterium rhodesiae]MCV7342965.1 site-specific integrase [Mycolicibacterium rhodesiae]ORB47763.1 recombinase XerD [Mycolicibacterium rhodesiae]